MKLLQKLTWLLTFMTLLLVAACTQAGGGEPVPTREGIYPIDPLFGEFYERLGGQSVLGPPITPAFPDDGKIFQYTSNVLIQFDPQAPVGQEISLAPLGRELGVYEMPVTPPDDPGVVYLEGHVIFDKFVPLFQNLGGKAVVGKPLTEVHKRIDRNRYEQYFENAGFYWIEGDASDAVYLLAYGDWKCDRACRYAPNRNSLVNFPRQRAEPFMRSVARLGLDFTGYMLTEPYISADGRVEQIYEKIVLTFNPEYPENVSLLSLPEKLGIEPEDPEPPTSENGMVFIPTQEGMGFNVPDVFMEFIESHGGIVLIGEPITRLERLGDGGYKQCFRNLCLQGEPAQSGEIIVRVSPLGEQYRELIHQSSIEVSGSQEPLDITVQIWESYPMIAPDQQQEIGVNVMANNMPLENVVPELVLTMPDGSEKTYLLPPTDGNGETTLQIEPFEAANGTLVPYKVCVGAQTDRKFCIMDSYLIWKADYIEVTPTVPPQPRSYLPFLMRNITIYLPKLLDEFISYFPFITK